MANREHLEIIRQGSRVWNGWREENTRLTPDLAGANLTQANLTLANLAVAKLAGVKLIGANLFGANLAKTDLQGAILFETDLSKANLTETDLTKAKLAGAKLIGVDLTKANLTETDLTKANLTRANLTQANFARASLCYTVFGDANLTDALELDTCLHRGPSILDHSTLAQSGPLPLPFLRGCGLPDTLIAYLPSLLNQALQFYSCFISYSTEDQAFAARLHADLQDKGVRCWFAPHDMQGGQYVHEQIDEAIQVHDRLLLILSEASMQSEWVKTEIAKARKRETREKRRMLFPVRLLDFESLKPWECFDSDIGKDSAKEIREYYVPDFSKWTDHDSYQVEFEKLLRDLKTEAPSPSRQ